MAYTPNLHADPQHAIVSHAQHAKERGLNPRTFNALRRDFPDAFPKAIRRGNLWFATRAEFDGFLNALRGTVSPGVAAAAPSTEKN